MRVPDLLGPVNPGWDKNNNNQRFFVIGPLRRRLRTLTHGTSSSALSRVFRDVLEGERVQGEEYGRTKRITTTAGY